MRAWSGAPREPAEAARPDGNGLAGAAVGPRSPSAACRSATDPRQLSFAKGDRFTEVKMVGQWHLARDGDGNEGLVPSNYVKARDASLAETSI